jgi:hypothetical protein
VEVSGRFEKIYENSFDVVIEHFTAAVEVKFLMQIHGVISLRLDSAINVITGVIFPMPKIVFPAYINF